MEIYLDSQFNGSMVVYSDAEAAEWAKKGFLKRPCQWTPAKYLKAPEPVVEPVSEAPVVAPEPAPAPRRVRKA